MRHTDIKVGQHLLASTSQDWVRKVNDTAEHVELTEEQAPTWRVGKPAPAMTQHEALVDLCGRVENGCGAEVILRWGGPVLVRTIGPRPTDEITYDERYGEVLARELCQVLMPKLGLTYQLSSVAPGERILAYHHAEEVHSEYKRARTRSARA